MKNLNHLNINKLISFGTNGELVEKSGKVKSHLVYMVLEFVPKMLFDICHSTGSMGEDGARYFMK